MSKQEAIIVLAFLIGRIGGGFHPDHECGDYINSFGPTFTNEEVELYDPMLEDVRIVLGEDIYTECLKLSKIFLSQI